jgi:L-ascorbate metabolism protein UlaG (beta-lactamase superfamily)
MLGNIAGFVLQAENQPTVYWIGDSIWCKEVEDAINQYKPDIVIAHTGGAILQNNLILMDADQAITVVKNAPPTATVVAIHMESLDHCTVTRKALRERATKEGISEAKLLIPENGDVFNVPFHYQVQ